MDVDSDFSEVPCVPKKQPSRTWSIFKRDGRGSPVPSTSAASTPSTSSGSVPTSVYSHIEGLEDIPQLRGLRTGRRRSRYRATRKAKQTIMKYAEAISILEPIFQEEYLRQQEAETLVAAAIEHFAITVTCLADKLEGKEPQHDYAAKIDKYRRRQEEARAKMKAQRGENGDEMEAQRKDEAAGGGTDDKEEEYRLQIEAAAAVAALSCGDKRGERLPRLFELEDGEVKRLIFPKK